MDKSSECDDATLLIQIGQQEVKALSLLYDRYARIIYSFAFKSLHSVEESEEVVLDVFSQVWRIASRFDPHKGRADTWLFTLTRSRILDRLRKMNRALSTQPLLSGAFEIQTGSNGVDLFEDAVIRERQIQVRAAMKKLPPEQRIVIDLAYFQGLSQSEIACHTGCALGTIKTRIRLGLNKLKLILDDNVSRG
ncbi:sigma-70 family RNA polymerase sigma factor [Lyngbya confervoides]|uniref:Sigma-70 family RNA polymerase sigma factor n=1 Tax=Lyngbya confervoides BDU141951 TaxID=1574623 RepID=A0ABD4T4P7_9CYAN|nr:sigma-70 family RNA polymerase sigma factor [Lyngbya confervoides]MCM1983658.1 sigma-70 family RNA polymerase sigma factor [Lyngbya confervoides BDU141951]